MNWDQYHEAQKPLQKQFADIMRKMEIDLAMGKMQKPDAEAMKSEVRSVIEKMFLNMDELKSINECKDTRFMMLADAIGLKGEKRKEMIEKSKPMHGITRDLSPLNKNIT